MRAELCGFCTLCVPVSVPVCASQGSACALLEGKQEEAATQGAVQEVDPGGPSAPWYVGPAPMPTLWDGLVTLPHATLWRQHASCSLLLATGLLVIQVTFSIIAWLHKNQEGLLLFIGSLRLEEISKVIQSDLTPTVLLTTSSVPYLCSSGTPQGR